MSCGQPADHPLNLSSDRFDQRFQTPGRSGGDDFLIDVVAVGRSGRDVARLPVVRERADDDRARCEACAESELEDLVEFAGNEDPQSVAEDRDLDGQGPGSAGGERIESRELSRSLFDLSAADAKMSFITGLAGDGFFGEPVIALRGGLLNRGQVVPIREINREMFPVPRRL